MRLLARIYRVWDGIVGQPAHETVLRMTLILLILHSHPAWLMQIPLRIICCMMLLGRGLERSRSLWTLLCALQVYQYSMSRFGIDHHKYLIAYWSIACLLSLFSEAPARVLAWNGRILVGLTFALAAHWKWLGGEFFDGTFFSFMLVTNPMFHGDAFAGVPSSVLAGNEQLLRLLKALPHEGFSLELDSVGEFVRLGAALAWITVIAEVLVAVAFLVSKFRALHELRHLLLISFALVTYSVLPVIGFGFLLMIMGYAQTPLEDQETRRWYLWALVLVQVSALPVGVWGA